MSRLKRPRLIAVCAYKSASAVQKLRLHTRPGADDMKSIGNIVQHEIRTPIGSSTEYFDTDRKHVASRERTRVQSNRSAYIHTRASLKLTLLQWQSVSRDNETVSTLI